MSTPTAQSPIHVEQVGTTLRQSGTVLKASKGAVQIPFQQAYAAPPVVVVSSFLNGGNSGVGHVETVTSITQSDFVVNSSNAANNYFVNWIAIGTAAQ